MSEYTDRQPLQPYRDRVTRALAKANEKVAVKESIYQKALLDKNQAIDERDTIQSDLQAIQRIEEAYPLDDINGSFQNTTQVDADPAEILDNDYNDDDTDGDDASDLLRQNHRRKRINIRSRMVELIRQSGKIQTLAGIIELASAEYGVDAVSMKTIQNRLGELTSSGELKKFYQRELETYSYGPVDWFEGNRLKNEYTSKITFDPIINVTDAIGYGSWVANNDPESV